MTNYCKHVLMALLVASATALLVLAGINGTTIDASPTEAGRPVPSPAIRFRIDSSQSKFIAHALRGGLLWFKGHEHLVAARQFTGEAQITPETIVPASLQLTVRADSMVETSDVFTDQQKQIINKELREIVFEPEKYPEIVFNSTSVTGKLKNGKYDVKIDGDLTLHGVTRRIRIPATVSLNGNRMRAVGEFSIDRSDFKVKATSAFHGLVRVRDKVKFEFDIVGERI
jgi:polyisoprenoid-binding protein YceI